MQVYTATKNKQF